ncbi:MAG: hypothetical protein WC429_08080, partial [Verrucomicrobiia bacterium]
KPSDTCVLIWAVRGSAELRLPVAAARVTVMRPFGKPLPVREEAGRTVISIGNRHCLQFRATAPEDVAKLLGAVK